VTLRVQRVKASGTIYIRTDGSVEGTDKISNVNNVTYTFTDNINGSIVVERDNIAVDGDGYTLQGYGGLYGENGFSLINIINVTIGNTNIKDFCRGIYLNSTYNTVLFGNIITNNQQDGIVSYGSSNNTILGNKIENYWNGIYLYQSSNDTVCRNNVTSYASDGIVLSDSSNNTVSENNIEKCNGGNPLQIGIHLAYSSNNAISDNTITENVDGIYIESSSSNNTISRNSITNNGEGIELDESSNNMIVGNTITNNADTGIWLDESSNNTIVGNKITNNTNCINIEMSSNYNMIDGNNITANEQGILLAYSSSNNSVVGNSITANKEYGIRLYESLNNTISGNKISNNKIANNVWGIWLQGSSNNTIYHNNFINNTVQVIAFYSTNVWDNGYPSGGNYWNDYDGTDPDYDSIGDTPYFINANNQDNYPLMGMFSSFNTSYGYAVIFISNSSISNFSFNLSPIEVYPPEAILAFNVSGKIDTDGFLRVCIPKVLINGSYVIMFDDEIITAITSPQVRELPCSNETYEYLYVNYTHSEHTTIITGTTMIPEFPSLLILPLFMVATSLAVIVLQKKTCTKKA